MNSTKKYVLQGKTIEISVPFVENSNNQLVNTSRYHQMEGLNAKMITQTDIGEFYDDIKTQIEFLEDKEINDKNFFEALIWACILHIQKYNRLVIVDLYSYLDYTMIIVDSTNGIFHNLIKNNEEGEKLRKAFEKGAITGLYEHIWVAKPSLSFGQQQLIPLKDLHS